MKRIGKLILVVLVVIAAVPVVQYRTLNPCGMLKKEWVERVQRRVESASERGQAVASEYGEAVERMAEGIGEALENVAAEVTARAAAARVEGKSFAECVSELWRLKLGKESEARPGLQRSP